MKNCLLKAFFVLLIIAGWAPCAYSEALVPVTGFDATWESASGGSGTGTVATQGGAINLAALGASDGGFWGGLFKSEATGIAGMLATLRVDQVYGNCELGLKATIGKIGNKRIQVYMYLAEFNGTKYIHYKIKTYDILTDLAAFVTTGTIGPWNGGWVAGKPQPVAFARFGSEIWFYADGYGQICKIQMLEGIEPIDDGYVAGYVSAPKGADAFISGNISDISLYYE